MMFHLLLREDWESSEKILSTRVIYYCRMLMTILRKLDPSMIEPEPKINNLKEQ